MDFDTNHELRDEREKKLSITSYFHSRLRLGSFPNSSVARL